MGGRKLCSRLVFRVEDVVSPVQWSGHTSRVLNLLVGFSDMKGPDAWVGAAQGWRQQPDSPGLKKRGEPTPGGLFPGGNKAFHVTRQEELVNSVVAKRETTRLQNIQAGLALGGHLGYYPHLQMGSLSPREEKNPAPHIP